MLLNIMETSRTRVIKDYRTAPPSAERVTFLMKRVVQDIDSHLESIIKRNNATLDEKSERVIAFINGILYQIMPESLIMPER